MNNGETKICKKCKEEINKKAKRCPKCGAKQGMPVWLIIVIAVVGIAVFANLGGGSDKKPSNSAGNTQQQEVIEYTQVTKDALDEALESNAAAAKDTYQGAYVEVSGKLSVIDSDMKYISLTSSTNDWDIIAVHCQVKNDEQREIIKTLTKGQELTVRGKITQVGETLGYTLDIIEIVTE